MSEAKVRCAICGKPLTAIDSMARGIGPVCWRRLNVAEVGSSHSCKECGHEVSYAVQFDYLNLPCNIFCCVHCPFAGESNCPRERVSIKKDIYPAYLNKEKKCSFCGEVIEGRHYTHWSGNRLTMEHFDCRKKNEVWRK